MTREIRKIAVAAVAILVATTAPAYAYIDPGMGSLALQALVGAVAGGLFTARLWWGRIVAMLPGGERKKIATQDKSNSDSATH